HDITPTVENPPLTPPVEGNKEEGKRRKKREKEEMKREKEGIRGESFFITNYPDMILVLSPQSSVLRRKYWRKRANIGGK
ncbi:MAG: hypothetical protein SWX82_31985, partial [Cyanobacteriota bacterium]|nr:hypothetical protein [Cyanobacteriota bacterium]